ncbi:hypothetical protein OOZ19_26760 [Saccharopolyspora sp. NFXS83]|uniref:hypothetical protein n=1 Tax=Saccharopolyspora sp. NFXS83 TaxID=2993560 RepID=UPI00224ABF3D|nr:hypothetical protein [Saccharopolyspora sp. NFXS83]MCX2733862.1 hypothetical protein [Saccharopolyspora sp. NFXS83]
MSTRTFPQSPTASSHLRPDRRQWTWGIGGVFALLFVVGLAVSCAEPPEDESSRPVPTGQVEPDADVLEPEAVPRPTLPPAATYEAQAPGWISAPEPAQPREPGGYEDCVVARAAPVHRGDLGYSSEPDRDDDGGGCGT